MRSESPTYRPGVHRLAVVTVAITVLLIFVGGVVTNTGSALAVPDWPTTFGYNMFLYPWSKMVGGIFYEHSHRLLGSTVGLLTVALAVWIYAVDPRRWVRRMMVGAVIAVIVQGILGGMRVVLLADQIAIVHGCLAQAFLSLMVGVAVVTSRPWFEAPEPNDPAAAETLRRTGLATAAAFYLQIVFGSLLTHTGTLLAGHLLLAAVATLAAVSLSSQLLSSTDEAVAALRRPAQLLLGLLAVQFALGLGSMVVRFSAPDEGFSSLTTLGFPILHRLAGTLLIATSMGLAWSLSVRTPAFRLGSLERRQKGEMLPDGQVVTP